MLSLTVLLNHALVVIVMNPSIFDQLVALSLAGIGLIGMGLCYIFLAARSRWLHLGGSLLALTGSVVAVMLVATEPRSVVWTLGILASVFLFSSAVFWRRSTALTSRLLRLTRQPVAQGCTVVVLGFLVVGFAVAKFDHDDQKELDDGMQLLEMINMRPAMDALDVGSMTDQGKTIGVGKPKNIRSKSEISTAESFVMHDLKFDDKTIRSESASDVCNCHGWVFTGGRYWIDGTMVEQILAENGYLAVTHPQPGDLAIYREHTMVSHTAIVRYTNPNQAVLVEGKWGWMGVFLHRADQSCYGSKVTYYRSPREGHLLVGLGGKPASKQTAPDSVTQATE
jgi:hypothetical protein